MYNSAACIIEIILHVNRDILLQIVQHSAFSSCDSSSDATMSTYKLTYFPVRARAEVIRFVFVQAGVKYEDVRIKKEDWPELKPSKLAVMWKFLDGKLFIALAVLFLPSDTPLGHLPILEVDGKTICGSTGIARFLAERFGK